MSASQPCNWTGELGRVYFLDNILSAQKLARETREGSAKTGRRLLATALVLWPDAVLEDFSV